MEPAGTPPPGIEGLSEKQRELMAKQHQAAKEQRKRDEDRLLDIISGAWRGSDCKDQPCLGGWVGAWVMSSHMFACPAAALPRRQAVIAVPWTKPCSSTVWTPWSQPAPVEHDGCPVSCDNAVR